MQPVAIAAIILAGATILAGQTRVRPEQIRNVQQVRIYWGDFVGPTTHLVAGWKGGNGRISDGRFVMTPEQFAAASFPADEKTDPVNPLTRVCVIDWFGIGPIPGAAPGSYSSVERIIRGPACYTKIGVAALHADPAWDAWLTARGQ